MIKESINDLSLIKSKFGEDFLTLRKIINADDPIGLISVGCPDDEYDPEVKTIIVKLELAAIIDTDIVINKLINQKVGDESSLNKK